MATLDEPTDGRTDPGAAAGPFATDPYLVRDAPRAGSGSAADRLQALGRRGAGRRRAVVVTAVVGVGALLGSAATAVVMGAGHATTSAVSSSTGTATGTSTGGSSVSSASSGTPVATSGGS